MGIQSKIDIFDLSAASLADDMLAKVLADSAAERLAAAQASNARAFGVPVPYSITVNNQRSLGWGSNLPASALLQLRAAGTAMAMQPGAKVAVEVAFLFTALQLARLIGKLRHSEDEEDVLRWIARNLRERSPVHVGTYRDAHMLLADGSEIANAADVASGFDAPAAKEYSFTNRQPYSRKIEIGKTESGRAFIIQVQNHIYERTAKDASARYGDLADISFEWRTIEGGYTLRRNQISRNFLPGRVYRSPGQRTDRAAGSAISYPTIVVRPKWQLR